MLARRLRLPLLLALPLLACGGNRAEVVPTVPVASAPAPVASVHADPGPDLSPLPAPLGLDVAAHLAHPRALLDQASALAAVVPLIAQFTSQIDPDAVVQLLVGAPLGPLLDLDAPVDFALADVMGSESPTLIAGSAALLDVTSARATLDNYYKAEATGPGVTHLEPREDAPDGATPLPCMIAPVVGGGSRLVCGMNAASVHKLGPYLTRTMTRVTTTADLRVEVPGEALHVPTKDDDDSDGGSADPFDRWMDHSTEQLEHDVGSLVFEASVSPKALDLTTIVRLAAAGAPLSKALLAATPATGAPPPVFDRLPAEASVGWYTRGASASALTPLRTWIFDAARGELDGDGYAGDAVEKLLAPFDGLFFSGTSWAVAAGFRPDAALTAAEAYVGGTTKTDAARIKARAALQGWFLAGIDEPASKWTDGVRAIVKLSSLKPTRAPSQPADVDKWDDVLSVAPTPASLGLPAGTLHVLDRSTPSSKWLANQAKIGVKIPAGERPLAHVSHLFVVPDGARTWIAVAEDPALAATEVRKALAGAPDAGTLASRHDLDAFRAMPATTGGFASVSFAVLASADDTDEGLHTARDRLRALAHLPDRGTTPLPLALSTTPAAPGSDGAGEARLRVLIPLDAAMAVATASPSLF